MLSPSPSLCFKLLSPSPLSVLLRQFFHCPEFFFFAFDFLCSYTVATHDLLSINLFSGSCSLLPISHPLIFPTVSLLAPSCPHSACHSLPPTFSPASSLIISFLYPSLPVVTSVPAALPLSRSPPHPPLFLPSSSLLWYHEHTDIGRVLKFICTSAADSTEPFQGSWL